MAEHGTPDLSSSQAPFIQALVQKSVTAITKLAGRLSFRMLRERAAISQGGCGKNSHQSSWRTVSFRLLLARCPCCDRIGITGRRSNGSDGSGDPPLHFKAIGLLSRLRTACRRNDAIHAQVFNHLSIMVEWMRGREGADAQSRGFHLAIKK